MATNRPLPPPCQVGTAWSPTLQDLDTMFMFHPHMEEFLFLDLNQCDNVAHYVTMGMEMMNQQRKEIKQDKHYRIEVALFFQVEPGKWSNLSITRCQPDY